MPLSATNDFTRRFWGELLAFALIALLNLACQPASSDCLHFGWLVGAGNWLKLVSIA